jgi:hypothetical protein
LQQRARGPRRLICVPRATVLNGPGLGEVSGLWLLSGQAIFRAEVDEGAGFIAEPGFDLAREDKDDGAEDEKDTFFESIVKKEDNNCNNDGNAKENPVSGAPEIRYALLNKQIKTHLITLIFIFFP